MGFDVQLYDGCATAERRGDVQESLRTAVELGREFHSDLIAVVRRGHAAQDQLEKAIERASTVGGLGGDETRAAETALSAVQYALSLLYVAGESPAIAEK